MIFSLRKLHAEPPEIAIILGANNMASRKTIELIDVRSFADKT